MFKFGFFISVISSLSFGGCLDDFLSLKDSLKEERAKVQKLISDVTKESPDLVFAVKRFLVARMANRRIWVFGQPSTIDFKPTPLSDSDGAPLDPFQNLKSPLSEMPFRLLIREDQRSKLASYISDYKFSDIFSSWLGKVAVEHMGFPELVDRFISELSDALKGSFFGFGNTFSSASEVQFFFHSSLFGAENQAILRPTIASSALLDFLLQSEEGLPTEKLIDMLEKKIILGIDSTWKIQDMLLVAANGDAIFDGNEVRYGDQTTHPDFLVSRMASYQRAAFRMIFEEKLRRNREMRNLVDRKLDDFIALFDVKPSPASPTQP